MKKVFLMLLILTGFAFAQQKTELEETQIMLAKTIVYTQKLETEKAEIEAALKKLILDLKSVKTIAQLDSVYAVYGIKREPEKK